MTLRTRNVAMSRFVPVAIRLPDFVTARAGSTSRVAVVETRAGQKQNRNDDPEHRRRNAR
jgi:hypothetical protein